MAFRPCIDLRNGKVVQIVGGSLTDNAEPTFNFESERSAADFAALYRQDGLTGGHMIMLGPGNESTALTALAAYPDGLQVGGGITPDNARTYLNAGASHVIVTSFLFPDRSLSWDRLAELVQSVGPDKLVIDLSCRKDPSGFYRVATNRWQTMTSTVLDKTLFADLAPHCSEFLIHAADIEGKCLGIDEQLVRLLGDWTPLPTTYAGGATSTEDIMRVEQLSNGKVNITIGSALDIFGGSLVKYSDAARNGRTRVS